VTYVIADLVHGEMLEELELAQGSQSEKDVIKGADLER
jgi:hypothetical protein